MILKEAFRMQNHLDALLTEGLDFLSSQKNVLSVTEKHMRNKSNPKAQNEVIKVEQPTDILANDVLELVMDIIEEKRKLAEAIDVAKFSMPFDMDSAISINKKRQDVASMFKRLSRMKSTEDTVTGQGYLIDNDGKQQIYFYDVINVSNIDFDRNKVQRYLKKLQTESDEISRKIDEALVTTEVDYQEVYDINDSFEDLFLK